MNILIIQVLRMGDALQLVPIIKGIKQYFPRSRICLLTSKLEALVLEDLREVDQAFVLDKELICKLVMTKRRENILSAIDQLEEDLGEVSRVEWDWVINFSYTFSSALLSYLINAKHHSGFIANENRQYLSKEKWFAYSLASFVNRRYSNFNWVDINKHIIGLGSLPGPPLLEPKVEDVSKASAYLNREKDKNRKVVGMHPGASGDYKRWPLERFGELGRLLVNKHGYKIVIFGGHQERELGIKLKDLIGDGTRNLAGKTTLDELKAFLSLCDLLVTNDTGPMHLASAVGTRTIGLFFSTHFIETGPYGPGHVAVHPDMACFPCQGTAKCAYKKCLQYISPKTIEAIIINGKNIQEKGRVDLLGRDKGIAKAYFSAFDPWGFIEWRPLDRPQITFQDIERILLKSSWLYYSDIFENSAHSEDEYLSNMLRYYSDPPRKSHLTDHIQQFIGQLLNFRELLETARKVSFDIHSELLKKNSDDGMVRQLGEKLNETETNISSFDKRSSISFLSELLTVFQENIEKSDPLPLSTRTISVYGDMMAMTDAMIKRSKKMAALLSEKV